MRYGKIIESVQNPFIKYCLKLQEKSKFRKEEHSFLVEGVKELELVIASNYRIKSLLFCSAISKDCSLFFKNSNEAIEISLSVFKKLAYRKTTGGVLAIVERKEVTLETLKLPKKPIIIVLESPEKPGNIGAILRTADASKVSAVILTNCLSCIYSPNIIRSSLGTVFSVQTVASQNLEVIDFLKNNHFKIHTTYMEKKSVSYHQVDYSSATALVFGTESYGLSKEWLQVSSENIHIPMQGKIDSLNLSVSVGIITFEAQKQRNLL